jgi:dihydroorotate dehydrogenase electron transfer subunit
MTAILSGRYPLSAQVPLARDTWRLTFTAPELAARIAPGQFVMVRLPNRTDPLLGRAFALYETVADGQGQPVGVSLVYLVVGKMTRLLAERRAGDEVEVWGPLGQPFPDYTGVDHLVLVMGGIGFTPMVALTRQVLGQKGYAGRRPQAQVARVSCYYGVRRAEYFAGLEELEAAGASLHLATDDGSRGYRGFVTALLREHHAAGALTGKVRVVGCGPEAMLHTLAELTAEVGLGCDVSLETPMACGTGLCFSCVTRLCLPTGGWDYRRVCVEGPTFDAHRLVWPP